MATLQDMITVAEAAQRLERSQEQIRRYLREGKLQGQRIGNQWFVDPSHLLTFTADRRRSGTRALQERLKLFNRVNRRREMLRRRWEKMGIHVDAVEELRGLREER